MGYTDDDHATWTDVVRREINNADITMSFWSTAAERWSIARYLQPHIDLAPVLIARMKGSAENKASSWYTSFYSFSLPFTAEFWLSLIAMVLLSGVVDFLVERKHEESKLTASLRVLCRVSLGRL